MPRAQKTPPAPAGLDSKSRALWRRLCLAMQAQGTWDLSDSLALERLVRSVEVGRLARARIAARAKRGADGAYLTRGSQGQLVQHPDLKTAREAERDAASYAADLLLSPRARAQYKLGLEHDDADDLGGDIDRALRLVKG
jgi:phage terminase small subunit